MATIQEAEKVSRAMTEVDPATYSPHLANYLLNLSIYFKGVGMRDEALAAIQKVVDFVEHWLMTRPGHAVQIFRVL